MLYLHQHYTTVYVRCLAGEFLFLWHDVDHIHVIIFEDIFQQYDDNDMTCQLIPKGCLVIQKKKL